MLYFRWLTPQPSTTSRLTAKVCIPSSPSRRHEFSSLQLTRRAWSQHFGDRRIRVGLRVSHVLQQGLALRLTIADRMGSPRRSPQLAFSLSTAPPPNTTTNRTLIALHINRMAMPAHTSSMRALIRTHKSWVRLRLITRPKYICKTTQPVPSQSMWMMQILISRQKRA